MEAKVLNEEQLVAVEHGTGPLLIIAGAGTGKTTVITERVKHLIVNKGVKASQILALTFTEKAAREMEERIDLALPYGYTQMWISTFHAFCDRILRAEAISIGLNPSYRLLTEAESILFLRKNLYKLKLDYFRPLGNPTKFIEAMLTHFDRLRDEDVSVEEYLRFAQAKKSKLKNQNEEIRISKELAEAYMTYSELKVKENVMDFSDLISQTLNLLRKRKNVLKKYQEKFEYVLVDEFQDTNYAQNQLAILLSGERKNITVVGDDDQAIYRWRGAAISNIIQFRKHFPSAKVVTLKRNYRSSQEILDKAYQLIQNNNPDRLEVKEKIDKKLISEVEKKGLSPSFIYAPRIEDEVENVVKKIEEITKEGIDYKDIAILVRANDHAAPFTRGLSRNNIPFQFLGPGRLFHQEEIKDLISYLKVLYDFSDSANLYRVLSMSIFEIEARDISALLNFARKKNISLFEAMEKISENKDPGIYLREETKGKIQKVSRMIKTHLKKLAKDSAGQILFYFIEETGILEKFLKAEAEKDVKEYQNIAKFFDRLKSFEFENEDSSVFSVVEWIDLMLQMGEGPRAIDIDWTEQNAVNILTVHSSKGLEFEAVFLVNLVKERFPTREKSEPIPIPQNLIKEILPEGDYHIQEERRLFYVGMTRARKFLFLTAASYYGEGKRERKVSPFVIEALGEKEVAKSLEIRKTDTLGAQPSLLNWKEEASETPIFKNKTRQSPPITYLSYSQLNTFEICPLHYKLRHILRVPTPPSPAQSFGTSIHAALRDFYLHAINAERKNNDIEKLLKNVWIDEGYHTKEHEKLAEKKALKILTNYLKTNFDPRKISTVAVEVPFTFGVKNGNGILKIGGRIDRIDKLENGKIEIVDYKTGGNTPDERKLANDLQLTIYALAATEVHEDFLGRKPEEVVLSLHFLDEGKKFTTSRTKEQLEEAKKLIQEKVMQIEESDFLCSGNLLCKNCEYKMLCSAVS